MPVTRPAAYWAFALCDRQGVRISMLTRQMLNTQMRFGLNLPSALSFVVGSESPLVNLPYTDDGYDDPYLAAGSRVIKAYRRVPTIEGWTLREVFLVWDVDDEALGLAGKTSVNCYSAQQRLSRRLIRNASGAFNVTVRFNEQRLDQIAKTIVDRTNAVSPTGIVTTGTFGGTTEYPTHSYDQQYIADGLATLCATGEMDIVMTPQDTQVGIMSEMSAIPMRGSEKDAVILAYGTPIHTAMGWSRTNSMETFANEITIWPGSVNKRRESFAQNNDSLDKYGLYEDAHVETGILHKNLTDSLVNEQIALRSGGPRDMITVTPAPEISALPWNQYFIGDLVKVRGSRETVRENVAGLQRVYDLSVAITSNGNERVTGLTASQEGA